MKTIVVLPAYNAEKTLARVVSEISKDVVDEIILVDDGSSDQTVALARSLDLTVVEHTTNKGYGANQKSCYQIALAHDADIVVMLHPDYQYDPMLIPLFIQLMNQGYCDVVLGSRIRSRAEALAGGMPRYKYIGNRVLTMIENLATGLNLSEWHTGMRAYSRRSLQSISFENLSDDFVFDSQILFELIKKKYTIGELPVSVRYLPESSSINFWRSVKYGLGTLKEVGKYIIHVNIH